MNTPFLIVIFVLLMVALALLPWAHRAWSERNGRADSTKTSPIPDEGSMFTDLEHPETSDDELNRQTQGQQSESGPDLLRVRITKARDLVSNRLKDIRGDSVDPQIWEKIEELLILADVGVHTTMDTIARLRATAEDQGLSEGGMVLDQLKMQMMTELSRDRALRTVAPKGGVPIWLFVGVNGVGKTTSIGKVARRYSDEGRKILLAAGDTFRAAAAEQLEQWALASEAELVRGSEGADPSSVIYDASEAAAARGVDLVLADTAGRLHNKVNLMEELAKVRRVADREPGEVCEVLLVIDATTGQNGLSQAREFSDAVDVTGVVLTKLDGSAKGGIVFAIEKELGLPVKLVGLGEGDRDLVDFDPDLFVEALFGDE